MALLMYGNAKNLNNAMPATIFNLSSLIDKYPLIGLLPMHNLGAISEYDFDMRYAGWILSDENRFLSFMNIIMNIYTGNNVYIIVDEGPNTELITESLLKLIQQRYGINATYISCIEDFLNSDPAEFSELGRVNLNLDKERYTQIMQKLYPTAIDY